MNNVITKLIVLAMFIVKNGVLCHLSDYFNGVARDVRDGLELDLDI